MVTCWDAEISQSTCAGLRFRFFYQGMTTLPDMVLEEVAELGAPRMSFGGATCLDFKSVFRDLRRLRRLELGFL